METRQDISWKHKISLEARKREDENEKKSKKGKFSHMAQFSHTKLPHIGQRGMRKDMVIRISYLL